MNMTPYTKQKIRELVVFINKLSQRQRDIRREISLEKNIEIKNHLDNERTTNSAVLRIAGWVKMTLEGKSLKEKLLIDPGFLTWYFDIKGFYIQKALADLSGWGEEKYINPCRWNIWRWQYTEFNQNKLYYYIIDMLFPDNINGLFNFALEDNIERDIWRNTFKELMKNEWMGFKELRGY